MNYMKSWVQYFVRERLDWMAGHSFKNCHAVGVDSIMFDDTRGSEIRLFVAHENHTLGSNSIWADGNMSVAFHPHHCQIHLHCVAGHILNINARPALDNQIIPVATDFTCFSYRSKIRDGESRFEPISFGHRLRLEGTRLVDGESLWLPSKQLHSIAVEKAKAAAWFVYEGEEDPDYQNIAYSNDDLSKWTGEGLYLPVTKSYICQVLEKVGLL